MSIVPQRLSSLSLFVTSFNTHACNCQVMFFFVYLRLFLGYVKAQQHYQSLHMTYKRDIKHEDIEYEHKVS